MNKSCHLSYMSLVAGALLWGIAPVSAEDSGPTQNENVNRRMLLWDYVHDVAKRGLNIASNPDQNPSDNGPQLVTFGPNTNINYDIANYANSPIIRKFVDSLPGLGPTGANNLGNYIPVAIADTNTFPGSDYYQIGLSDYYQKMHSDLPPTRLRGYIDLDPRADGTNHYLGPVIIAQRNRPSRIKFTNLLPAGTNGNLFIPVDTTYMGAGDYTINDPANPNNLISGQFSQNRADLHLHGGLTPWISDGTTHQWITPAAETNFYAKGMSFQNVPDMVGPGKPVPSPSKHDGVGTYYYPNQQSSRLMFYHDHAYGMTRLNVYAGEASGYLLYDTNELAMIQAGILPDNGGGLYTFGIPLIIQDKTFVPDPATLAATDPLWDTANWGGLGSLWFPHVYMANQDPTSMDGTTPFGRWDYGPWFWPVFPVSAPMPTLSGVPEAFMDTPVINGTPYPYLTVEPKAYRFRVLNACNDRFVNLQLYYADPTNSTEVAMFPAVPGTNAPASWPTDGRAGGIPNWTNAGPNMIQIGTEGGFLPAAVILTNQPISYEYNRRSVVVLNVNDHTLFLGPAERADIIIDFSTCTNGSTIILYNDAPAPVPAFDTRIDYYTGDPDQTANGGAPTTLPGFGPNTRTMMQFRVSGATGPGVNFAALNTAISNTFVATQPKPIVPNVAYGDPTNYYSRIQDNYLVFTNRGASTATTNFFLSKAIQELFDPIYGRMNATLGVEMPFTSAFIQTTIPYYYIDPTTEILSMNEPQIWKITHNGVDTHAIHFHLVNVQVVNRVGWDGQVRPPDPNELGWKETVRMNPLEDIIVAMRPEAPGLPFAIPDSMRPMDVTQPLGSTMGFTGVTTNNLPLVVSNVVANFGWEYVWHCHLLGHEENDMMRPLSMINVSNYTIMATATLNPAPNALGWNRNNVTVSISGVDYPGGPGIATVNYRASGAQNRVWTSVAGTNTSYVVSSQGTTTINFYVVDLQGIISTTNTVVVKLDKTAPSVSAIATPNRLSRPGGVGSTVNVRVNGTIADGLSGVPIPSVGSYTVTDSNGAAFPGGVFNIGSRGAYSFTNSLPGNILAGFTNRIYTIRPSGADNAGNLGTGSTTFVVGAP
jgi:FtsP/CotA-like multicopper oxidase with cupredoxin domain